MGLLDLANDPMMGLAGGLLGGGNFGQALTRGLTASQAMQMAEQERKLRESQAQENAARARHYQEQMRQAQEARAQSQAIQGAARDSFRTPEMANGMNMGPLQPGQPQQQFGAGLDTPGFINRVMQINPIEGMKLQAQLAKESQINKLDAKDFTPESVQRFHQSGNYGDLKRMDKLHFGDTGGGIAGLDPYTGQKVSETQKTGNPFSDLLVQVQGGGLVPNAPLIGAKQQIARAGATNVNNTVSMAGPENEYNKSIGAGLAKEGLTLVDLAKQAPEVVRNAQMIRKALDSGAITGTGAEARLALEKAMATVGLVGEGRAASTQELMSGLGKITLAGVKTSGLGAGNGFTDKDREFLQGAISGTIDSTPANLRRVADLSERISTANHQKGAAVLGRWQQDPALRAVSQDSVLDPLPTGQPKPAATAPKRASLADIQATARAQGKSTAEVTADLRARGYEIGGN